MSTPESTVVRNTSQSSTAVSRNAKGGWSFEVKVYDDDPSHAATMAVDIAKRVAINCPTEGGGK